MRARRAAEDLWKDVGRYWLNMQRALVPPAEIVTLIADEGATSDARNLARDLVSETRRLLDSSGLDQDLYDETQELFNDIFDAIDERDDRSLERALLEYACFLWKVYLKWLVRDFAKRSLKYAEPIDLVLSEFSDDVDWERMIRRLVKMIVDDDEVDGVSLSQVSRAERALEHAKRSGEIGKRTFRHAKMFLGLVNRYNEIVQSVENPCGNRLSKLSKGIEDFWRLIVEYLGDMIDAYNEEV